MNRVGNILNNIYDRIMVILFIILLLFSTYTLYDTYRVRYISSGGSYKVYKPDIEKPEAYKEISDECIGWITLNNSDIDYPIMQAKDNVKYLNTNPYGEYALSGSIFLDWQNKNDFSDKYNLLYGHKMSGNLMFGALSNWENKDYYDTHLDGTLTVNNTVYNIKVFAFVITDAKEKVFFDPTNHTNQYDLIKQNHKYFSEIPEESTIIALSTCRDPGTTDRTILFTYIMKGE